jgi:hypothetical protein
MRTLAFTCLGVLLTTPIGLPNEKTASPAVKVGKYKDLTDIILKNKGKVIVVDFWFTL